MKIRTDFVTNSSSVSYILTMCEEMVDVHTRFYNIEEKDPNKAKIIKTLRDDMHKNGTCVFLEGKEIITKRIKFNTDETLTEDVRETPIEKMTDEELWSYILGEYIMDGKLSGIMGFGITQIETF
ncbi:MAG: hypothetical protein AUJ50_00470 [Candidatus Aenigmarchaeota archaeon CG1_02_38_14]|nr:MAG: hypothetical protein AUJ50_00470 [Candidatus Aenigmarchaeota archaeon CG1_02_38_14]